MVALSRVIPTQAGPPSGTEPPTGAPSDTPSSAAEPTTTAPTVGMLVSLGRPYQFVHGLSGLPGGGPATDGAVDPNVRPAVASGDSQVVVQPVPVTLMVVVNRVIPTSPTADSSGEPTAAPAP
jgi:hypothetical protein